LTHISKEVTSLNSKSLSYIDPTVNIGVGIEGIEVTKTVNFNGLRIVDGSYPLVGVSVDWVQGCGHKPLTAPYGLHVEDTLEVEVAPAKGQQVTTTLPNNHADLYWALHNGKRDNYAIVLPITFKTCTEGTTARVIFDSIHTNSKNFWSAAEA
jgi:hypothetical protein